MGEQDLRSMLHSYLRDAHAMEENVLRMLDSMITTTDDPEILRALQTHKTETEGHEQLLKNRLESLNVDVTAVKDVPAIFGALMKGIGDVVRSDKPGKNARDGYVTEAMEIAAYHLLENLAQRAGDQETADLARRIRADEERMRDVIDQNWPKFVDLTLAEKGIPARG